MGRTEASYPLDEVTKLIKAGDTPGATRAFRGVIQRLRSPARWDRYVRAACTTAPELSTLSPAMTAKSLHAAAGCMTTADDRKTLRHTALDVAERVQIKDVDASVQLYKLAGHLSLTLPEKQEVVIRILDGAEKACEAGTFSAAVKLGNLALQRACATGQRPEVAARMERLQERVPLPTCEWHHKRFKGLARMALRT